MLRFCEVDEVRYDNLMDPIHRLEYFFTQFPGVGARQSRRFVYYLLKQQPQHLNELSRLIAQLPDLVLECADCHRFFPKQGVHQDRCRVCLDPQRDASQLLIVEKDADLEAIERAHAFNGFYFVLGGTLGILEKNPERVIRMNELRKLIARKPFLKEVIVATAVTPESEHTGDYIHEALRDDAAKRGYSVTTLGRGISTGSEIEYADADTLRNAIIGRK